MILQCGSRTEDQHCGEHGWDPSCVSLLTPRSPGDERTIESPLRREQKSKEKLLLLRSTPTQKRCQHLGCLIIPNCFHRSSSLLHTESARPPRVSSWVSSCYLIKQKTNSCVFSPSLCSVICSMQHLFIICRILQQSSRLIASLI